MQISAEMTVIPTDDARRSPRRPVNFIAWVRDSNLPLISVHVADISEHGCRLIGGEEYAVGASLVLKISGLNGLRAHVVRSTCGEIGCEFTDPLHKADLALLLRLHQKPLKKGIFRPMPQR